ncbi:MAG: nicotinamide-nucleotide amidohydrolase family protein [Lachnospiraceae bacterium]
MEKEYSVSTVVKTWGFNEEQAGHMVRDLNQLHTEITAQVKKELGEVHLLVLTSADTKEAAEKENAAVVEELKSRFREHIYTTDPTVTLEEEVVTLLKKHGLKLATAESCTGGMIGSRIVNVPGSSEVYRGGLIVYSNKLKKKFLDVSKKTLKEYGAVSHQTAKEMVRGCLLATEADMAVAVTGIAGPGGGTAEKPVGLVYISCASNEELYVSECHFKGSREEIRAQSATVALGMVRNCILKMND